MAIIPLRAGGKIVGLLQLNDHHPNQFTPGVIRFFEGLGASIGIALSRQQSAETLSTSERYWQTTFNAIANGVSLMDATGHVLKCNAALETLLGKPSAEIMGRHCFEVVRWWGTGRDAWQPAVMITCPN